MKSLKGRGPALTAALLAALALLALAGTAHAQPVVGGPVILGGDDLTDHGCVDAAGDPIEGWLYMQRALENLSPNVTRANDGSVAALGSSPTVGPPGDNCGDAGAGIAVAAAEAGLTVNYYDGAAAINGFFTALAAGTVSPRIIWVAGNGASNDMNDEDEAAVTANAAGIDAFVNSGGGLMAHSDEEVYGTPPDEGGTCTGDLDGTPGFLTVLIPGLQACTVLGTGDGDCADPADPSSCDLQLTPDGMIAFPGLSVFDINAGPWHNYFQGDFGGLQVLATSNEVRDGNENPVPVILGGEGVSLTIRPADLAVTKTDSPDPVYAGDAITYTITVSNNGPEKATNAVVRDPVPAGTTLVSHSTTQGSCAASTATEVRCDIGDVPSGEGTVTITVVVRANQAGTVTNSATATSDKPDPNATNDTATATTTVLPVANLGLAKTDSPDPVPVGQNLTYTLAVTNTGPSAAPNTVVTDTLPAGVTLVSATASQGSCAGTATITCNLGTVAVGATPTVTLVVRAAAPGSITNSAQAASDARDPNTQNNTATATTQVIPSADLGIAKTASAPTVQVGGEVTYTLTATNAGPSGATGVTVTDSLPAGLALVSATPSQGTCSGAAPVSCAIGALASGASATVAIVARATAPGSVTNTAEVRGAEFDPAGGNNQASVGTTVRPAPLAPPPRCSISVRPGGLTVGERERVRVSVRRLGTRIPASNTRIVLRGAGVRMSKETGRRGVAVFRVTARKAGVIRVRVPSFTRCRASIRVSVADTGAALTGRVGRL